MTRPAFSATFIISIFLGLSSPSVAFDNNDAESSPLKAATANTEIPLRDYLEVAGGAFDAPAKNDTSSFAMAIRNAQQLLKLDANTLDALAEAGKNPLARMLMGRSLTVKKYKEGTFDLIFYRKQGSDRKKENTKDVRRGFYSDNETLKHSREYSQNSHEDLGRKLNAFVDENLRTSAKVTLRKKNEKNVLTIDFGTINGRRETAEITLRPSVKDRDGGTPIIGRQTLDPTKITITSGRSKIKMDFQSNTFTAGKNGTHRALDRSYFPRHFGQRHARPQAKLVGRVK